MTIPRISVVVPFYNLADVLGDCLQSIATQTFRDLEVVMVDDGSTDGSAAIARAQADADGRFHLVQVPNGGPGYARNRGIERARGEFLAFVDGDDMVPSAAYETLLHSLSKSGSDFACGNVYRFGPWGIMPSAMHARAIKGRRTGTHITRAPQLLYDMTIWNKLYRKDFWDQHGLRFPEGVVYEDVQLATRAHVLARAVDVVPDYVYDWRHRGQGTFSITQSRTDIGNLRDRLGALLANDRFLTRHGPPKLLRLHQRKALGNDIWLYAGELTRVGDDYRAEFLDLVNSYLDQVRPRVLSKLTAAQKLTYHLIGERMLPELLEFLAWLAEQPRGMVPVVRSFGRLRADLPFRGDPRLGIPGKVYRPYWRELDPFVRVEQISWQGGDLPGQDAPASGKMSISGRAYIPSVSITKRRHTSKFIVLRPRGRLRPPLVLRARSLRHPDATALSGQERYCYEWAGFRFGLSPRLFRLAGRWLTGEWECYLLVRCRGVWRPARLHTPVLGQPEHPDYRDIGRDLRFRARWEGRNLIVGVVRTGARAVGHHAGDDGVTIDVELPGQGPAARSGAPEAAPADGPAGSGDTAAGTLAAELVLRREGGAATLAFPAEVLPAEALPAGRESSGRRLRGRVAIDALVAELGVADRVTHIENAGEGVAWEVYVRPAGRGRLAVAAPARLAESRYLRGGREIVVGRTRYGNLVVSERTPRPVIDAYSWRVDGCLELRGSLLGREGEPLEAVLCRRGSGERHRFPVRRDGQRFTIEIGAGRVPAFGWELPLRDGTWDILVQQAGTSSSASGAGDPVGAKYDHARLADVREETVDVGPKRYRFMVTGYDNPVITAEARRGLTEKGRYAQRLLRKAYYPARLRAPLRDAVVFISWKGKQCADNPRGIADELRRRGDDREHIWVVTDPSTPLPEGATVVLSNSQAYFDAVARSRYVIANDDMPPHYRKREGQIYLQTWHGTPLKRIGFDVPRPQFASGATYLDHLAEDVAKWDLLLSPNPFSTPIMRRAFRFGGEICEYGYPRNDVLSRPDSAEVAAVVRRRLGLPDGKRVVLYAPTWRDNQFYASGRYRFDLRLDLERAWQALGDEYVILLRGHHQMAEDVPDAVHPGFAINVTRYPDISELCLVSDVLLTDYSSVMFDYASSGRPMLFFTYDLEDYRDNLRGFYFDFEREAPGPLLATSDDVIAAIKDLDGVAAGYTAAYHAFAATYCALDDGKAGARVCDRLFGS